MKKLKKNTKKIRKEEFDNYNVDGYKIGQSVRLNNKYDYHTIYEIVALDTESTNKSTILLNDFDESKLSIEHFENLPIVYKKGAKKNKYTKWIESKNILEVIK